MLLHHFVSDALNLFRSSTNAFLRQKLISGSTKVLPEEQSRGAKVCTKTHIFKNIVDFDNFVLRGPPPSFRKRFQPESGIP